MFEPGSAIHKRLRNQVWIGAAVGLVICLCIGGTFIALWYTLLSNAWGSAEYIWEGVFALIATLLITAMGLAMLKTERMQEKWKVKLAKAMEKNNEKKSSFKLKLQRYSFFLLPFITVLREGLEAVVFIGGVSLNVQAKSIPIAAVMGFLCGCLVGVIIYRGGSLLRLRWFFIISTVILYLVAAGLMSRAVGFFETNAWNKIIGGESVEESGTVIPYKVTTAVWHVSWGNPENLTGGTGGWQIFNAILGWNNTATIGTITSYCLYWVMVAALLVRSYWKDRSAAIKKAESGEWTKGDDALEKAKQFVGEDGEIGVINHSVEQGAINHNAEHSASAGERRTKIETVSIEA
ncbi:high-affinity iron permease [Apophysomyces sp. BC1034]|nr:high-affinity iron permease [Apophysomyces sp. BC1015]KAG0171253.1 high-affinity iron permease [Apophysomyces sp. BC1021]KAG0184810.1 high-affinity iron permease [Apophysomyces sp. BC1034]